jgi:hypothetical protein
LFVCLIDDIREKLKSLFKKDPVRNELPVVELNEEDLQSFLGEDFSLPTANDERYAKYVKMKAMLPDGAVRQKMQLDGFTEEEIDGATSSCFIRLLRSHVVSLSLPPLLGFMSGRIIPRPVSVVAADGKVISPPPATADAASATISVNLSKYEKYEKMKKMLPEGAVRNKMKMDGFPDNDIDDFMAGRIPVAVTGILPLSFVSFISFFCFVS